MLDIVLFGLTALLIVVLFGISHNLTKIDRPGTGTITIYAEGMGPRSIPYFL